MSNCWQSVSQDWSPVNCSLIPNTQHLNWSIWRALSKEKKPSIGALQFLLSCLENSLKCFDSIVNQSIFYMSEETFWWGDEKAIRFRIASWYLYSMKIKEQTRKLAAGCSKHCFEVADRTDEVSSKHCFEVVDKTDEVSYLYIYGKATLTWFEEIFEEY